MFKEHVSKLSDAQLKNRNRLCLGIAIGFLFGMAAAVGFSLFQVSNQDDNAIWTALMPSIIMPIIFIPLLYSSALSAEIKKRKASS